MQHKVLIEHLYSWSIRLLLWKQFKFPSNVPRSVHVTAVAGDLCATLSTQTAALERLHTEQTLIWVQRASVLNTLLNLFHLLSSLPGSICWMMLRYQQKQAGATNTDGLLSHQVRISFKTLKVSPSYIKIFIRIMTQYERK